MAWITEDRYLTETEQQNNANIVITYYQSLGINNASIAALLGNLQAESTVNPGLTERGGGGGFGLVQWTPVDDLISACSVLGISPYTDGNVQLEVIYKETINTPGVEQWYSTEAFISPYYNSGASSDMIGITGEQFLANSMGWQPDKLAVLFMAAYERPSYDPGTNHYTQRMQNAMNWYDYIGGGGGGGNIETVVQAVLSRAVEYDGHMGKNQYTQDAELRQLVFDEPTGYSDCSSLMWKAFQNFGSTFIGTYTGDQLTHGTRVWYNEDTGSHTVPKEVLDTGIIQRGDLIFYGNQGTTGEHVEMYLGNSSEQGEYTQVGHGSGWGPTIKSTLTYNHPYPVMEIRRYVVEPEPEPPVSKSKKMPLFMYLFL